MAVCLWRTITTTASAAERRPAAGEHGGAAAHARFDYPSDLALLLDGLVLVMDSKSDRVRLLSADLHGSLMKQTSLFAYKAYKLTSSLNFGNLKLKTRLKLKLVGRY